jgi:hypothetical protein
MRVTNQNLIPKEILFWFVISSVVEKHKSCNIQDYNFACVSVWVLNLVSDIKGGTLTEGF